MLASEHADAFLRASMARAAHWRDVWRFDRLRTIVNACTRMRFCTGDGAMDFKESAARRWRLPAFDRVSSTRNGCRPRDGRLRPLVYLD